MTTLHRPPAPDQVALAGFVPGPGWVWVALVFAVFLLFVVWVVARAAGLGSRAEESCPEFQSWAPHWNRPVSGLTTWDDMPAHLVDRCKAAVEQEIDRQEGS